MRLLKAITYPFCLVRNAVKILRSFGVQPFLHKTREYITRLFVLYDSYDDNVAYSKWIRNVEKKIAPEQAQREIMRLKSKPLISVLVPVYNVEAKLLRKAVESVRSQYYTNWELCLNDDKSTDSHVWPMLKKFAREDPKIKITQSPKNLHIPGSTNRTFDISKGDYILLMDNDDELTPDCLFEYVKELNKHPNAGQIYCDEDKLDMEGKRIEPFFKPDFSPELLLSMMYPTHCLYQRETFEKAGKMRAGTQGSQDYDLCLRVSEITDKIYHIPKVLYHWRKIPQSTAASVKSKSYVIKSARKALKDALERRGLEGEVQGYSYPFRVKPEINGKPSVEIIIPTKDKLPYLKRCLKSIAKRTDYSNFSVTIVDNESEEEKTIKYLKEIGANPRVKVLQYSKKFNFADINNFAVSKSGADYVLFLNNDTEVIEEEWLTAMLEWAQLDGVGPVGAKLLFPDHRVQHAGVILGLGGIANHAYYRDRDGEGRYFNHLQCVRNYSAVTAACMLVSRRKFLEVVLEVGGFDAKNFPVSYNDVDLCLRMAQKGYRTVYTPYARLFHFESVTRPQYHASTEEEEAFRERWGELIENDPYCNPNFRKDTWKSFRIETGEAQTV